MSLKNKRIVQLSLFALLLIVASWILVDSSTSPYQKIEGRIFGTYYHITYQSSTDYEKEILEQLNKVDCSLSTFNDKSIVSLINRNESNNTDAMFRTVFKLAQQVADNTQGAFDVTVAPLVNLWGFGFKNKEQVNQHKVDSLKAFVGYKTVKLQKERLVKQHPETMLDFSAIAKGYGCDVVADFLEAHGVGNYMIEIGGEIRASGINPDKRQWTLGIEKPVDDSTLQHQELYATIQKSNMAIATSGNYRNFYYQGGHKYAHTISPFTGYPVQHKMLSATVSAPSCSMADAYATAFMVMGMDKAKAVLAAHSELDALFIYTDNNGNYQTWCSEGFSKYVNQ